MPKETDIRIVDITTEMSRVDAREPLKFGASVVPDDTYCLVTATVENRRGERAKGHGGIWLMDFWAFPDPRIEHPVREKAMIDFAERFCTSASDYNEYAHPIDIALQLEELFEPLAKEAGEKNGLPYPLPRLAQLVCASPLDAALHDGFGNVNGICTYDGYGPEFCNRDLSAYLGPEFKGKYVADYIRPAYPDRIPAFHLVGGLDTLRNKDVAPDKPDDGLPWAMEGWIERDGLTCLKVKLRGTDLEWDLDRICEVYRIAQELHAKLGISELHMSADTNEQCESPDYIVEMLRRLKEQEPGAFEAILYIEQPTSRDLRGTRHDMSEIAALKPVIIDESLTSLEDFDLAMETNWSGVALKSCKGQSSAMIFASRAREGGIPYTVQDLTNPDIALVHSAGMAARIYPMMGVETNSCQYFPAANERVAKVHPGVCRRRDGQLSLESLGETGLGFRWDEMV